MQHRWSLNHSQCLLNVKNKVKPSVFTTKEVKLGRELKPAEKPTEKERFINTLLSWGRYKVLFILLARPPIQQTGCRRKHRYESMSLSNALMCLLPTWRQQNHHLKPSVEGTRSWKHKITYEFEGIQPGLELRLMMWTLTWVHKHNLFQTSGHKRIHVAEKKSYTILVKHQTFAFKSCSHLITSYW